MRPVNWGRLLTAMVTPFDNSYEIDYRMAERLAKYLVENGTEGIVVNGTTGEAPCTTTVEKLKLLECVLDAVGQKAKIIAGCGTNSTGDTVQMTKEATKLGVHGIMLVTPYYNKPPQKSLIAHFTEAAKATHLPVMLYNVPGRTGVNLLAETVEALSSVPNIAAVKEASGNLDQVSDILRRVPKDFLVYSGDDSQTLPILSLGGHGIVSVASHIVGLPMKRMIDAYLAGDVAKAAKAHLDLFPIFKGLFMTTSPIPVKAALKEVGYDVGTTRLPLTPMGQEELAFLKKVLRESGIFA